MAHIKTCAKFEPKRVRELIRSLKILYQNFVLKKKHIKFYKNAYLDQLWGVFLKPPKTKSVLVFNSRNFTGLLNEHLDNSNWGKNVFLEISCMEKTILSPAALKFLAGSRTRESLDK